MTLHGPELVFQQPKAQKHNYDSIWPIWKNKWFNIMMSDITKQNYLRVRRVGYPMSRTKARQTFRRYMTKLRIKRPKNWDNGKAEPVTTRWARRHKSPGEAETSVLMHRGGFCLETQGQATLTTCKLNNDSMKTASIMIIACHWKL